MTGFTSSPEPIADLAAVAERAREHAIDVYRCDAYATPHGRWNKTEIKRHAGRKGELLTALDQAADGAHRVMRQAGIGLEAAEGRILNFTGACCELLAWAWKRRGKGAWHNRRDGEGEEDYCERIAETAWSAAARPIEDELLTREASLRERTNACLRLGRLTTTADAAKTQRAESGSTKPKCGTVNQRMSEHMQEEPLSIGWSQRKWSEFLECKPSAVAQTKAWKTIMAARAVAAGGRVDQRTDRRRRPRRRSQA